MKERGFKHSSINWKVYLPNGYTHVEKEIPSVDIESNDSKIVMAISGCDKIVSKSNLWILLNRRFGRAESAKIIPESYVLAYKKDMDLLRNELNQRDNNAVETDIYILKKNLQRKEGLLLTRNRDEILNSCNKGYKVAQKYINNPLLVKGRKVNLRLYLMIVSHHGKIKAFLHQYGKCIYTAKPYDSKVLDFENNITSFGLNVDVYKNHPLTLQELFRYLQIFMDTKLNADQIKKLILVKIHSVLQCVMIATNDVLGKLSNLKKAYCGQLFGLDFVLTNEVDVWQPYLLEFNKGPDMTAKTVKDGKYKKEVIEDMFNLLGLYSKEKNGFEMVYPSSDMLS